MEVYRTRSSLVWGWVSVGLGVAFAVVQLVSTGLTHANVGLGLGLAIAAVGVAVFLRPSVVVKADAVELHNITLTVVAPFARIAAVEAHWTLELIGDDGRKAGSFAAPSRSGREHMKPPEEGRSAEVTAMIAHAWDEWKATDPTERTNPLPADAPHSFHHSVDYVGVAWVVVAVASAAVGFLL